MKTLSNIIWYNFQHYNIHTTYILQQHFNTFFVIFKYRI